MKQDLAGPTSSYLTASIIIFCVIGRTRRFLVGSVRAQTVAMQMKIAYCVSFGVVNVVDRELVVPAGTIVLVSNTALWFIMATG